MSGSRPICTAFSTLMYWPNEPPISTCSTSARSTPTLCASTVKPA